MSGTESSESQKETTDKEAQERTRAWIERMKDEDRLEPFNPERTDQPSDWTVAGERERCIEIVRSYLSARAGIRLARHPHGILEEIIEKIRRGVHV